MFDLQRLTPQSTGGWAVIFTTLPDSTQAPRAYEHLHDLSRGDMLNDGLMFKIDEVPPSGMRKSI